MSWIKWLLLVIVLLIGAGWLFRIELALWGIGRVMSSQVPTGPTQEVNWSTPAAGEVMDPATRPPNVILILADDLGWNDLSVNGGEHATVQTPNIDALAAGGANFHQGYAANGTCAPSRAALMSGRYGTRFGFEFTPTPGGMTPMLGMISATEDRPLRPASFSNEETNKRQTEPQQLCLK